MYNVCLRALSTAGLVLVLLANAFATPHIQRIVKGGVSLEYKVISDNNHRRTIEISVADAASGEPYRNLHPLAWLSHSAADSELSEAQCKAHLSQFLSGGLSQAAEVNLNSFRLLVLNSDKTISVINPEVAFSKSKLEKLITLPSQGSDWLLDSESKKLFVALPESDSVAVFDMSTYDLLTTVKYPNGSSPTRLSLQAATNRVWVSFENKPAVAMIDVAAPSATTLIEVGSGLHNFGFVPDNRFVYVTSSKSNTVSKIRVEDGKKIGEIQTGETPVEIAYGITSNKIYVSNLNDERLTVIDPNQDDRRSEISVTRGTALMRFDPEGRFSLMLNAIDSTVSIFDSSSDKVIASSRSIIKDPDQITFSERYAYIHSMTSPAFSVIELSELRNGHLTAVAISAGTHSPSDISENMNGQAIVRAPDGSSAFVANPSEKELYYYSEGMMVPTGTLDTYSRSARGLLVLDHSIKEVRPGVYAVAIDGANSGTFDFPILIDQPRLSHCFLASLGSEKEKLQSSAAHSEVVVNIIEKSKNVTAGIPVSIKFELKDPTLPIHGLRDAVVMAYQPPGTWHRRRRLKELASGGYQATWIFPEEGSYDLLVSVPSRGIGFAALKSLKIEVKAAETAETKLELKQ